MTISVPRLFSLARMTTATTGTGTITLGSAATVNGTLYLSFSAAGVSDGDIVAYGIQDTGGSEYGYGTYTAAGTTLTRNVIRSTNSNNAINLSGSAQVFISAGNAELLWGFTEARNMAISASAAANILTVSLKTAAGNDPSANDPVLIPFRSATASTGTPDVIAVRSALSIDTNTTGASLGSTSGSIAFRFWLVVFNNSGTAVLGLINCVAGGTLPTNVYPLSEDGVASSTAMSGTATSAGVFYTPNGTTVSSKPYRILGYIEYGSGLTTAGTYASGPTKIQIFGPGIKKPGDIVQVAMNRYTTAAAITTPFIPNDDTIPQITEGTQILSAAVTPSAAPNVMQITLQMAATASGAIYVGAALFNGATDAIASSILTPASADFINAILLQYVGLANQTTSITFTVRAAASSGTVTINGITSGPTRKYGGSMAATLNVQEIMG